MSVVSFALAVVFIIWFYINLVILKLNSVLAKTLKTPVPWHKQALDSDFISRLQFPL